MRLARLFPVLALTTLVAGSGLAAGVGLASGPRTPAPVTRSTAYYERGPSAEYDGDAGFIGGVEPLSIGVPDGTWDALVTITLEYRTKGSGPFEMDATVRHGERALRPSPRELHLRESRTWATATGQFVVRLHHGTYGVEPAVNSVFVGMTGVNKILTRRVVTSVDLTPAG